MKKIQFLSLMLAVIALPLLVSCSKDDDGGIGSSSDKNKVVVDDNGKTSNGSIFSAIDDKNFYLDYIKYTVEEGHLVVSGYDKAGFKGVAKIVSSITYKGNTYEVLGINYRAFEGCSGLTSITIPNSVTSIGRSAFYNCSGLTSVKVENENTIYDSRDNCNAIIETSTNQLVVGCKNTIIPNSVTSIGDYAFYGCSGLTSVTIPNSVKTIRDAAFEGCSGLTSITIPNSVIYIGGSVFDDCI